MLADGDDNGPLTLRPQQLRCVLEEVNATTSTLARVRDRLLMLSAALREALDDLEAEQRAKEQSDLQILEGRADQ